MHGSIVSHDGKSKAQASGVHEESEKGGAYQSRNPRRKMGMLNGHKIHSGNLGGEQ